MQAHNIHSRDFQDFRYVYPVLSRRAGGISIGINLSPHKACNFDCLYCQVDRSAGLGKRNTFDEEVLAQELISLITLVQNGELFDLPPFTDTPQKLRRLNDIALSGDGEPSAESCFLPVCKSLQKWHKDFNLQGVKLILISNSTLFHKAHVQEGIDALYACGGEVWAKLDAGTEDYYKSIDKSSIPFGRILENITLLGKKHEIIIQTLFTRLQGALPSNEEISAFGERLNDFLQNDARINHVQIHTVARQPASPLVEKIDEANLNDIAQTLRKQVPLEFRVYPG
ncbi:MAG: radical SAM protein [Planctomycetes bacterium]|nr:radical SAM protein [Planctomycetota bacterium]